MTDIDKKSARTGVLFALAAYGFWGIVPMYFKAVAHVPATQVLAHRVVWAVLLTLAMTIWIGRGGDLLALRKRPRALGVLAITSVLIAVNWFVYIWAIVTNRVIEASLGYYINPIVNVALGVLFLGERLRHVQIVCVALAATAVGYLTWKLGAVPYIPLTLAFSFGSYALLRKKAPVDALQGLTVECIFLLPLAIGFLLFEELAGRGAFMHVNPSTTMLLIGAGFVTSIPLLWFSAAAKRLRLSTMGFLQYVAPSLQFLLAVTLYGEIFTAAHKVAFPLIWIALALYSWDTWKASQEASRATAAGKALEYQPDAAK